MRKQDLIWFRSILLRQKSELLNKCLHFKQEVQSDKTIAGDEADLATFELDRNLSLRFQERERVLIQKIDKALAKMERGTYGFCEECDEPLDIRRLRARPVACLCIACKEDQESRERIYA